jgi:hypothetical protein
MSDVHFVNLTNGIEAIRPNGLMNPHFIRLQSTACEQTRWGQILLDLSDDFLLHAAMGDTCYVYDYGASKFVPRAIWQGLEWVKYALNRRWYSHKYEPVARAATMGRYFDEQYEKLDRKVKNRLDYFVPFLAQAPVQVVGVPGRTTHDGDKQWYAAELSGVL